MNTKDVNVFCKRAIEDLKCAVKQFGQSGFDNGAEEVMNIKTLADDLIKFDAKSVIKILVKLSKHDYAGEQLVSALLDYIDGASDRCLVEDERFEEVFESESLNDYTKWR